MLRDGWLDEPLPGVLTVHGAPRSWHQHLQVATLSSRGNVVAAGFRSAAALIGMDGYRHDRRVELVASSRRRFPGLDVTLHVGPLDPCDVIEIDGIRCTTVARTLADLGSVDHIDRAREAFEWAWRNGCSLTWLQQTVDRLHRPGQRGTSVLQRLILEARLHERPTESGLEVELGCVLDGIPGLVRQHTLRTSSGEFVARVDLAVPAARLAIEAHSRQFHFGPGAVERDAARDERIVAIGWTTMYVTKRHMASPVAVRAAVLAAIDHARSRV
jgi:very-short-patch-repair endonuclease